MKHIINLTVILAAAAAVFALRECPARSERIRVSWLWEEQPSVGGGEVAQ